MKILNVIITLFFISSIYAQNCELISYRWLGENSVLGKSYTLGKIEEVYLSIPKNYKQSHWHYGEGVVTTLGYSDSTYISLHIGFTISKPFLKYSANIDSVSNEIKIVRSGILNNLYWKEVNYNELPISVFYENVSASHKEFFDIITDNLVIKLLPEK